MAVGSKITPGGSGKGGPPETKGFEWTESQTADAALAFSVIGDFVAGYFQSRAYALALKQQEEMARWNAEAAERRALDALERGELASYQLQRDFQQLIGANKAKTAQAGVKAGVGSAAALEDDDRDRLREDLFNIRFNAYQEALGLRRDATSYNVQGDIAARSRPSRGVSLATGGAAAAKSYIYNSGEFGDN